MDNTHLAFRYEKPEKTGIFKRLLNAGVRIATGRFKVLLPITALLLVTAILAGVIVTTTNLITIEDGGQFSVVTTMEKDPQKILDAQNIQLGPDDQMTFSGLKKHKGTITITRALPVKVYFQSKCTPLVMLGGTVADALSQAGITLGPDDLLNHPKTTPLVTGMSIVVTQVKYVTEKVTEAIAFTVEQKVDATLTVGQTKIEVKGQDGIKTLTYQKKFVNGKETEVKLISETVTKKPVKQVELVGSKAQTTTTTKPRPIVPVAPFPGGTISPLQPPTPLVMDANGVPQGCKNVITGRATAYTAKDGSHTATGRPVGVGYIAVNPNQIPYGTEMYVVSADGKYNYGYCIAADTGGFVNQGKVADLFFATEAECRAFGVRDIVIYVL